MKLEVIQKINEIDLVLRQTLNEAKNEKKNLMSAGFLGGIPGLSLFYYLNYLRNGNVENIAYIEKSLEIGFHILNNSKPDVFHCNGISGFMNGLNLLNKNNILDLTEVINSISEPIDGYLTHSFEDTISKNNFDFLHGAEGILNYFLNRDDVDVDITESYLNALNKSKNMILNKGVAWKSNIVLNKQPTMVFNLGMAHGMTSTIILLSRIVEKFKNSLASDLLVKMIEFYRSAELPSKYHSSFPNWYSVDIDPKNSRLGWCYGDLGIGVALLYAGTALKDGQALEYARSICEKTIKRTKFIETGIRDAGLCHGTSGVAVMYDRIARLTGLTEYNAAADYWITETIRFSTNCPVNAGYKTWSWNGGYYETNVLSGIAGIGIALNSSLLKIDTKWDSCLLLS